MAGARLPRSVLELSRRLRRAGQATAVAGLLAALLVSPCVPAQDARAAERERMVREQIVARGVSDAPVLDAMRSIPRHEFMPQAERRQAYRDTPLPIGFGQTISQPYIVALMTELLHLSDGDRVLEVGTGSGYQAAVLRAIVEDVYTIEIVPQLHRRALELLRRYGFEDSRVLQGDGYFGLPEQAPFDAIIVTAAADHVPPPLIEQLRAGGRMIIPVGPVHGAQRLVLVRKDADGRVRTESVLPVRFVPLTGSH